MVPAVLRVRTTRPTRTRRTQPISITRKLRGLLNVRFAPKATELLRQRELSQGAKSCHMHCGIRQQLVAHGGALTAAYLVVHAYRISPENDAR